MVDVTIVKLNLKVIWFFVMMNQFLMNSEEATLEMKQIIGPIFWIFW